jgi:hypothetical protein
MEHTTIDSGIQFNEGLTISNETITILDSIRKWTKFLAILGFVFVGLMVILGLFMGSLMSTVSGMAGNTLPFPSAVFTVIYLIFALIYFFPVLYLYQFSSYLGKALASKEGESLTAAFKKLNSHYKYIGIIAIIIMGLYGIIFVGAIVVGIVTKF